MEKISKYAEVVADKPEPRDWSLQYEAVKDHLLASIRNAGSWSSSNSGSTDRKLLQLQKAIVSAFCNDSVANGSKITVLNIGGLSAAPSWPFEYLTNLEELNIDGCRAIRNEDFTHLPTLKKLEMCNCHQITDAAFTNLKNLEDLDMSYCSESTITDAAFTNLKHLTYLNLYDGPTNITPMVLVSLYYVKYIVWKDGTNISSPLEIAIQLRHLEATAGIIANQIATGTLTKKTYILNFLRSSFDPVLLEAAISRASAPLAENRRLLAMHAFRTAHGPGGSIEVARREHTAAPHGRNLLSGRPVNFETQIERHPLIAPATATATATETGATRANLNLFGENTPIASSSGGYRSRSRPRSRSRRYKKSRRTKRTKRTKRTRKMVKKN